MYGKIFEDILYGSLMCEAGWLAVYVFSMMVVVADKDGLVRYDKRLFYERIFRGYPDKAPTFDEFTQIVKKLASPDPASGLPECEGRRIIPMSELTEGQENRGWLIVNYEHYRRKASRLDRTENTTERVRRFREKQNKINDETPCNANGGHIDTDQIRSDDKEIVVGSKATDPCPHQQIISLYHEILPTCPRVRRWNKNRQALLRARWRESGSLDYWEEFFERVKRSDFLTGKVEPINGRTPFLADLEWLIKEGNHIKVIEGKYDPRGDKKGGSIYELAN